MELKQSPFCPLIKEDCKQLGCSWFTRVCGKDPQNGREIDEWGCAVAWLPTLLIATANEARQGAAATESFRNAVLGAQRQQSARPAGPAPQESMAQVVEVVSTPPQIQKKDNA